MRIQTDLAFEAQDLYEGDISGVTREEEDRENVHICRVTVNTQEAAQALQKAQGQYVTLFVEKLAYLSSCDAVADIMAAEMGKLLSIKDSDTVLVVGLGNRAITADALGPKVVSGLVISRHLKDALPDIAKKLSRVCAVAPGVLGITGIETGEMIQGICDRVKPTHIIAIDALAAAELSRVANTLQLSDTGIVPGSGVGNHRNALTRETMGVPVVAIGVPTVVSIGAVLREGKGNGDPSVDYLSRYDNMVVTPKEIDSVMDKLSTIIALAINRFLHPQLTAEEMSFFLS